MRASRMPLAGALSSDKSGWHRKKGLEDSAGSRGQRKRTQRGRTPTRHWNTALTVYLTESSYTLLVVIQ